MFQRHSQVRIVSQSRTVSLFVLIKKISRFHLFRPGFCFRSSRTVHPTFMTLQLFSFELINTGLLRHMRKNDTSLISHSGFMIVVKCFQLKTWGVS